MGKITYLNHVFEEWLREKNTKTSQRCIDALNRDIAVVYHWRGKRSEDVFIESTGMSIIPNYLYFEFLKFREWWLEKFREKDSRARTL